MRKYVIMGAPGCGKGTQAKLIANRYDLVHISVGDIFRLNIQNHTKLAARIKRIVNAGRLVPDEIVDEVVDHRLRDHDWNYGFILDGFPRNKAQAEFFLESYDIDAVVLLDVDDAAVIERVQARRLCSDCGLDYNLIHHRPAEPNVCDVCGGSLIARADDVEETVLKRLADYREQTEPVVDLFMTKELVVRIDGMKSIEQVNAAICNKLGLPPAEMLLA